MHLLIPFAASHADAARDALSSLRLPQLERLLGGLTAVHIDRDDEASLSPPHERALAQSLNLSVQDGRIPWAAHAAGDTAAPTSAWAWITLCHWENRSSRIFLREPQDLGVTPSESQTLLEAMRPYFAEDGITLTELEPGRWLAQGGAFRDLACASLDRVVGRRIDVWMPQSPPLLRLQNEMQMLLYTHAVNDDRSERGALPINSFWISGAGALPADFATPTSATEDIVQPMALRDAAVREDWSAWAQAWQALDAGAVTHALQRLQQGESVTLTLCGERSAQRFEVRPIQLTRRIANLFRRQSAQHILSEL
jgi:hypothetical protein